MNLFHATQTDRHSTVYSVLYALLSYKGKGKNKEGYSLFSLFDRTKSHPGREKLKDWMMKPVRELSIISHRQYGIGLGVS